LGLSKRVEFGGDMSPTDENGAQPNREFEFEVVTVNGLGEIIGRDRHRSVQLVERLDGGSSLEMVVIPGGTFLMGSRPGHGYDDEHPQHSVRVPPFLMGKYPITQEEWKAVMGWIPPCRCSGARRPVNRVSWDDARAFCARLSQRTSRGCRLPSEAEWEYACRAETTTPFHFGETITTGLANYVGEHTYRSEPRGVYRHETTEVGSFLPNAFGLYDMHGNVWEWCADAWHDNYEGAPPDASVWEARAGSARVLRGGCWHDPPDLCRSAARLRAISNEGEDLFGFRVALASPEWNRAGTTSRLVGALAAVRVWLGSRTGPLPHGRPARMPACYLPP
jgi:formylglycine-generating enzyme required for sulfatase activity